LDEVSYLLVAVEEAVRINDDESCCPIFTYEVVGIVRKTFRALNILSAHFSAHASNTHEIPTRIIQGSDLGLEIHTALSRDNVVVTETLVPEILLFLELKFVWQS
jgi:hypothetical protein